MLKKDGKFLVVEPLFHVSKAKFDDMKEKAASQGFKIKDTPKKKGGRALLLSL